MTQTPKRAWPLLLLAGAAYIPFLGFLFGSAAVTWALLTDRPRAKLALVLGGLGAILQIAATAAATLWFEGSDQGQQYQVVQAQGDLSRLVGELDAYKARTGKYPNNLQTVVGYPIPRSFVNIYDQSAGVFKQRLYTYRPSPDRSSFDLLAVGPDGLTDTADDIRPRIPDSIVGHTGYQPPE